jgi:integrase
MAAAIIESIPHRDRIHVFGIGASGYQGWSKGKDAIDKAANLKEHWTVHDLRRTCATGMAGLEIQPHVIEAVLNHVSGHKSGVAGIYNRNTYAKEKRAALDLWATQLNIALAKASGANVTTLRKA